MQTSDEHSPTPGRPSLPSLDQQAQADRYRILADLDEEEADLKAGSRGMLRWIAIGGLVASLGIVGGLLLLGEEEKPIVPAVIAAPSAMQEPAVATAPQADQPTVSAGPGATILSDEPVIDQARSAPVAPLPAAATEPAKAPVEQAVAPARAKPAAAVKTAKVAVRKKSATTRSKGRAPGRASGKKKVAAGKPAQGDTEVALVAALVTHAKATQTRQRNVAPKLKQCKTRPLAERRTCRARICAAAKEASECTQAGERKKPSGAA